MLKSNDNKLTLLKYFVLIALPILVYPAFIFISTILDILIGDSFILLSILYDSKSILLNEIIDGWMHSIPYAICLISAMFLVIYLVNRRNQSIYMGSTILIGTLLAVFIGTWLYFSDILGIIVLSILSISLCVTIKLLFFTLKAK